MLETWTQGICVPRAASTPLAFRSHLLKWHQNQSSQWARRGCPAPMRVLVPGSDASVPALCGKRTSFQTSLLSKTFTGERFLRGFQTQEENSEKSKYLKYLEQVTDLNAAQLGVGGITSPSLAPTNAGHSLLSCGCSHMAAQLPHHVGPWLVQVHLTSKSCSLSHLDGCRAEKESCFYKQKVLLNVPF